ncbi:hypothetical protein HY488_03185 [Candidatus Woesearchaeota archaeon]|nr:hypothetical protein [Candidatus Woesearchaeota archaeon]
MVDNRDKVLQIVRMKGPLLPSQINRELNTNLLFASAMLSELVDSKVLKISHLKVGGSPLYYHQGQEARLQEYAKKLNEKDYRAYELLRQAKVLRDRDQEPLIRACLREIKDFAVPLEVNFDNNVELFWKWYLLPNEDVELLVRQRLGLDRPRAQAVEEEQARTIPHAGQMTDVLLEKKLALARKVLSEKVESTVSEKRKEREEAPKEREKKVEEKIKKEEKGVKKEETVLSAETFVDRGEPNDKLFKKIKVFFDENKIRILSHKIIRKETDIEFTIEIPSAVGKLPYFCKAKDKQKCTDGDLSAAYVQSQSKKLPILFISTGELTKKAQDILRNEFKSMTVKQL